MTIDVWGVAITVTTEEQARRLRRSVSDADADLEAANAKCDALEAQSDPLLRLEAKLVRIDERIGDVYGRLGVVIDERGCRERLEGLEAAEREARDRLSRYGSKLEQSLRNAEAAIADAEPEGNA